MKIQFGNEMKVVHLGLAAQSGIQAAFLAKENIESPSIFGRIGGEEFLAIIYNSSMNYLHDLCEKIRQVVEKETTLFDNQKIKVTISGGGAFTSESLNISDLVNKADERLYLSKKNGRNKFYLKED